MCLTTVWKEVSGRSHLTSLVEEPVSWFPHPPIPHLPLLAGCVLVASFHKHHLDLLLTYLLVYLLRKGNCCNSWFSSHLMNSGFTFAFWKGRGRVYRWSCQVVRTCSLCLPGPVAACQAELWLCGVCLPVERASETMLEAGGSPPPPSPCSPVLHTPGSAFFLGTGMLMLQGPDFSSSHPFSPVLSLPSLLVYSQTLWPPPALRSRLKPPLWWWHCALASFPATLPPLSFPEPGLLFCLLKWFIVFYTDVGRSLIFEVRSLLLYGQSKVKEIWLILWQNGFTHR